MGCECRFYRYVAPLERNPFNRTTLTYAKTIALTIRLLEYSSGVQCQ